MSEKSEWTLNNTDREKAYDLAVAIIKKFEAEQIAPHIGLAAVSMVTDMFSRAYGLKVETTFLDNVIPETHQ